MEYKVIKDITIRKVFNAHVGFCQSFNDAIKRISAEFLDFYREYLDPDSILEWDWLYSKIKNNNVYMTWLIDHGFIEKVEEEFYSVGDEFKSFMGNVYKLNSWGEDIVGLNDKNGSRIENPFYINCSPIKIPASDFHKYFGNDLKKIKE